MKVKIMFILIVLLSISISCKKNSDAENVNQKIQVDQTVNGKFADVEDGNAFIEIKNNKYIMSYKGKDVAEDDIYDMKFANSIKTDEEVLKDGKFLELSNKEGSLQYSIESWTSEEITLVYLSRGKTIKYKKIK
ncbi:MAG: hypothetical protein KAZ87_12960 [Spirochaetes bacterium]|nr:hypothetical protein [Spirochaetota bacterium]